MIPLDKIQAKCEEHFGCPTGDMLKRSKLREYADARKAFRMIADRQGYSIPEMNNFFKGFDHSSIYSMQRVAEEMFLTNKIFGEKILRIEAELKLKEGVLPTKKFGSAEMPECKGCPYSEYPNLYKTIEKTGTLVVKAEFEQSVLLQLEEILAILKQ